LSQLEGVIGDMVKRIRDAEVTESEVL